MVYIENKMFLIVVVIGLWLGTYTIISSYVSNMQRDINQMHNSHERMVTLEKQCNELRATLDQHTRILQKSHVHEGKSVSSFIDMIHGEVSDISGYTANDAHDKIYYRCVPVMCKTRALLAQVEHLLGILCAKNIPIKLSEISCSRLDERRYEVVFNGQLVKEKKIPSTIAS